jgi:type I restriction enzyme S subunit
MPQNWKIYRLGDIAEIVMGQSPKGNTCNAVGDGVPLLNGPTEFGSFNPIPAQFTISPTKISEIGDVLFCVRGSTTGRMNFSNQPYCIGRGLAAIRGLGGYPTRFIKFVIDYYLSDLLNICTGSTFPNLSRNDLNNFPVKAPLPSDAERIASILGALDDKIELNLEMNKTLEEMAMALYKHWFVEGTNNINESRPLEEILDFIVDNRGKTAPTAAEGIPLIATNCVKNERIFPTYEKVRYIGEETYANWFRSHPIPGDIIFVNKGAPGSVNLVPDPIDFCIAQDMIALRVNNRFVSNYYLFSYFRSAAVQNEILNMSVGTTIPHLKKTDLLKFNIPIPKSEYLKKYTEKVTPIFEMLNLNQKENQTLSKTRDTILPKLISGEIEVKEVEEEVSKGV